MVTLTLRVEHTPTGPRFVFHHAPIDAGDLTAALNDLAHGTYVQADCEYVAGVGMRAVTILAVTAHSQPSPRTSIRALVEKREYERAIAELDGLGDSRVLSDPALLIARACARIGSGDEDGAAADLRHLLTVTGVTSLDVRDVFDQFGTRFGPEAIMPLAKDFVAWVAARRPVRATSYLASVPIAMWPIDLVLTALEEAIEAIPPDPARVRALLEVARNSGAHEQKVRTLWAQAAARGLAGRRSERP